MLRKKLVKYGNSTALILDKAILELLDIREGSTIQLSTDGKSLILTPMVSETVIYDGPLAIRLSKAPEKE